MLKLGVRIEQARPGADLARSRERPTVAVAADHGGFELKEDLKKHLESSSYLVLDFGTTSREACDYPDFAHAAAVAVAEGTADRAIVVDGAGIGSAIVANKVPGIRAAKCDSLFDVENSRRHNDANVLSLSARLERSLAREMARVWLETPFEGGRHARRVDKIRDVEHRYLAGEVRHGHP
ncbi:MAG: RpiB/LacA/LacB family sugar-phosphate isomerase [Planctomycetes bacterium]|nr:RpiB/LacA/LacB family sugar-phosphate isomerase [Planctomycetota bacterium]